MAIQVVCHQCNKTYSVKEELAGKNAKCPNGHLLTVPGNDDVPTSGQAEAGARPSEGAQRGGEAFGLAEEKCPECKAVLAPGAVLCVNCGLDLRTGQKVQPKKKAAKRRAARAGNGPERATLDAEADKRELGKYIAEFKPRLGHFILNILLGILALPLGGVIIVAVRAVAIHDTMSFLAVPWLFFLVHAIGISIAGAGGAVLYSAFRNLGVRVRVHANGFLYCRGGEEKVFLWSLITGVRTEARDKGSGTGLAEIAHAVTVERADGEVLHLDGAIDGIGALGKLIKQGCAR